MLTSCSCAGTDRTTLLAAALGAATALAGLLLVFQGFLLSSLARFGPADERTAKLPLQVGAGAMGVSAALGLVAAGLALFALEGSDVGDLALLALKISLGLTLVATIAVTGLAVAR